jgi:hypothetical protein
MFQVKYVCDVFAGNTPVEFEVWLAEHAARGEFYLCDGEHGSIFAIASDDDGPILDNWLDEWRELRPA